jgi:hypothetical protein
MAVDADSGQNYQKDLGRPEILKNMMVHSKKHKIFDIFFPLRDRHNHPIII